MTASSSLARRGLAVLFASSFLELTGYFMLSPLLLLRLKAEGVDTAMAGLFAAMGWLGIFLITPFASALTRWLGRRPALWLSAGVPVLASLGFALSYALPVWFACSAVSGLASGLRWVLAESIVAEFSPAEERGRYVGFFQTMVGATFIVGPMLLAGFGAQNPVSLWWALAFMAAGLAVSLLMPALPRAHDADDAHVGWRGVWMALRAHPVIMIAGFSGGYFESGLTAILPLYGLALGLGAAASALLVSASGLGSAVMMLPAGLLADRMSRDLRARWGDAHRVRLLLMQVCAALTLAATLLIPWVAGTPWLAAPVAFVWGGAGGSLYTLCMIDIGSREQGIMLVNSTAVLVLSYTLGGVLAPITGAMALQWAPTLGFPALLLATAAASLAVLLKADRWLRA